MFIKILMITILAFVFYYSIVYNILLLIQFMKLCLFLGAVVSLKELFVLIVIKKRKPKEIAADLGISLAMYIAFVVLLLLYLGLIFIILRY